MTTTPKRKPAAKKKPAASAGAYTITMQVGQQTFTASGDDITEAIRSLSPGKISAKTIFTLEHDGKTATLARRVSWARRTLADRTTAFYLGRNLLRLLK